MGAPPQGTFQEDGIAIYWPLGDRVLVRRDKAETQSKGGILLPDQAQQKTRKGVVVAVGPGKKNEAGDLITMEVKQGDHVLIPQWGGSEVGEGPDQDLVVLSEGDILAVIEEE